MDQQTASTIIAQLGGRKFMAMTGVKQFIRGHNDLSFQLPKFPGIKINAVFIKLNNNDLYDVEYQKFWIDRKEGTVKRKTIATSQNIFFDELRPDFEAKTGLRTNL